MELPEQFGSPGMIWFAKLSNCIGLGVSEVCFPHFNWFQSEWLEVAISYGCHDANKNAKSGKILRIFQYKDRAVT